MSINLNTLVNISNKYIDIRMADNEGGMYETITFSIFKNVPEENTISIPIVSDLN